MVANDLDPQTGEPRITTLDQALDYVLKQSGKDKVSWELFTKLVRDAPQNRRAELRELIQKEAGPAVVSVSSFAWSCEGFAFFLADWTEGSANFSDLRPGSGENARTRKNDTEMTKSGPELLFTVPEVSNEAPSGGPSGPAGGPSGPAFSHPGLPFAQQRISIVSPPKCSVTATSA